MRTTRQEQRRRRKNRKIEKMELRAAKAKNKVSGQFMNRVVISMILAAFIFTVVSGCFYVRMIKGIGNMAHSKTSLSF